MKKGEQAVLSVGGDYISRAGLTGSSVIYDVHLIDFIKVSKPIKKKIN